MPSWGPRGLVVLALALGKGLKAKREPRHPLLAQPPALYPAEPSPTESWPDLRARLWESCSQEAGRAMGRDLLRPPSQMLRPLRLNPCAGYPRRPPKGPESLVGVGEGSGCPAPTQTERIPQVFSFLQSGGVTPLWRPVAISKLFHSWVGKRSSSYGVCDFGAGIKGTSEKLCQPAGSHSAKSWKKTENQSGRTRAGRPSVLGRRDPLRPPGRSAACSSLLESSTSPGCLWAGRYL